MAKAHGGRTFGAMTDHTPLTIRVASPRDDSALRRLAALDSARPLTGRVLLAESDGRPIAALSLGTGAVRADPFEYTEGAVQLLRLRRYHLLRQADGVAPARSLLRRLAQGAA
jgi:hypothetical protein